MEPNAIFWLEFQQAKRNFLLYGLLCLGILQGTSIFFFFVKGPTVLTESANLSVVAAHLLAPLFFGWKIASQRLNEDLCLYTPLTPYEILNGKILFGLVFGCFLYGPVLIAAFVQVVGGGVNWLSGAVNGFLFLQYEIIVVIGFMAGARSTGKAAMLVFLLGVFSVTLFVLNEIFRDVLFMDLDFSFIINKEVVPANFLGGTAALFSYFVGIAGLSANLKRRSAVAWGLLAVFLSCLVVAVLISLRKDYHEGSSFYVIALFFYFVPLIAAASLGGVFEGNEF